VVVTVIGAAGLFFTVSILTEIRRTRKLRLLAQERHGESICTFARSLNYRRLDTKIIRAVHEELQEYLKHVCPAFPVRAADHVEEVYQIDPEDYEDMVVAIADRVGRSLADFERNPYYHQSSTVAGLIEFLCAQPKASGA
jgi:hypothetical protein